MILQRKWIQKNHDTSKDFTESLDVWDGGWCRYERLSNGKEFFWEVLDRQITETGFTETLRARPPWDSPGKVLHRERLMTDLPMGSVEQAWSHFETAGWRVEVTAGDEDDSEKMMKVYRQAEPLHQSQQKASSQNEKAKGDHSRHNNYRGKGNRGNRRPQQVGNPHGQPHAQPKPQVQQAPKPQPQAQQPKEPRVAPRPPPRPSWNREPTSV